MSAAALTTIAAFQMIFFREDNIAFFTEVVIFLFEFICKRHVLIAYYESVRMVLM